MPEIQELSKVARKVEQISQANLKEVEYVRQNHAATIPIGTVPEDLLLPEYWAHVASKLKPWDRIEARALDGTWFAEYLVLDVGRTWVKVKLLTQYNLTTTEVSVSQAESMSPLEVRWRGPIAKWSVVRKSDNAVMAEGMDKDAAHACLAEYIKANR